MSLRDFKERFLLNGQIVFWRSYSLLTWPPRKLKASFVSVVDYTFSNTVSTVHKLLLIWAVFVMLVIFSLMLYATFYSAFVPTTEISRPIFLEFSVCSSGTGICSFPTANVSFWNEEGTVQEFLGSGQAYTVDLMMVMPDSHANRDLGMFMVAVKMYDRHGQVSIMRQRSTMFRYKSIFLRVVDMVVLSPLYFLGLMEQKMVLMVEMFPHFVDDYYHPTVGATVEVHSYKIEIYSATLRIVAKLKGLKYFLHNWPLVSAFCAFWFNLFLLATGVAVVLLLRRVNVHKMMIDEQMEDEQKEKVLAVAKFVEHKDVQDCGTQTGLHHDDDDVKDDDSEEEDDDLEMFEQPLVQEPADFPVPEETDEFFAELRHRRIQ